MSSRPRFHSRLVLVPLVAAALGLSACSGSDEPVATGAPEATQTDVQTSGTEDSPTASATATRTTSSAEAGSEGWEGQWQVEDFDEGNGEGRQVARLQTDGAELTFTNDATTGLKMEVQADEFTREFIDERLCLRGCRVLVQVGGEEFDVPASRPSVNEQTDPTLSLRQPRDIFRAVLQAEEPLVLSVVDPVDGVEHQYEFDVAGASAEMLETYRPGE